MKIEIGSGVDGAFGWVGVIFGYSAMEDVMAMFARMSLCLL